LSDIITSDKVQAALKIVIFMDTGSSQPRSLPLAKRIIFRLVLLLFGTLLALLLAEIVLRAIGYSSPVFYSVDSSRGYALTPNMQGWYRKEGTTYITVNSDGLRDVEHATAKPTDTFRIAIIGDSYSEALQVNIDETFWKILEQKLNGCGDKFEKKKIEVINFGVSGYGTAQEFLTLRERAWKYSPDLVLLAVTTNNDITDNYRAFKRTEIPYFVYRGEELMLDDSFKNSAKFKFETSFLSRTGSWFRDNLRVIQGIQEGQTGLKYWWKKGSSAATAASIASMMAAEQATAEKSAAPPPPAAGDVGIDNEIYRVPKDDQWKEAWRVTEGIILQMHEETQAHGAKFVVVTLSNGAQVLPDPKQRADQLAYLGVEDIFYPDILPKQIRSRS
jgi:hypothetical protein